MADQALSTGQLIFISKYICICDQYICIGLFVFNSIWIIE